MMNDLKKMISDRLHEFGAETLANDDPALVQFRQTPATLAKAVMPVFPEDPAQLFEQIFEFWIEPDERGVVCLRGNGNEKEIPRKFYFLLSQLEAQKLDARNLVEFVVSMQRTGIPFGWRPFADLPGFPANVLTRSAERILRAPSGVSVL
jgi:hypothetical protein